MRTRRSRMSAALLLILAALGVVYGDIGTSPLYAVNQIFLGGSGALVPIRADVLGSISLIFWALAIIVSLKYLVFVVLADHEGHGGVFALLGILEEHKKKIIVAVLLVVLLLSAGLLLGEGVMTPAISVLAAVEGLAVANPAVSPYLVLIASIVLTILFAFQYKGTHRLGIVFGPIMVAWFVAIALIGVGQIIAHPDILWALNPLYGIELLTKLSLRGLFYLFTGIVLSISGVEALYADLGHFGKTPLRHAWLWFVYPALLLSYFGQGAFLLGVGKTGLAGVLSVFYATVPAVFLYPMIALATLATVVASQALISGAYSLIAEAIALNYLPRFKVIHTNRDHEGQIYVPAVNWFLYIGAVVLVITFGSSTALASAYGFAIAGVMLTTTLAMAAVAILWWRWPLWRGIAVFGIFTLIDLVFLLTTSLKFMDGGWVPVAIGGGLFILMISWHWGRQVIAGALEHHESDRTMRSLIDLKKRLTVGEGMVADERGRFVEADRAVIFLIPQSVDALDDEIPIIVRAYMRRNGAIPKHVVLLHIDRVRTAYVRKGHYRVVPFGANIWSVSGRFGFMEDINLHAVIAALINDIPVLKHNRFLLEAGTEEIHFSPTLSWWNRLRLRLFRLLQRLATPTYRYFGIESSTSLSTTTFHIYVDDRIATIRLPELDLV